VPWRSRLEARLLLFVALVAGVSVAAMLVAANRLISASALERHRQDQDAAKAAFDRLIEQRQEFVASQTRLITELPVFRAHLSDPRIANDEATIEALAQQYRESTASDFLLVANADLQWLGKANWPTGAEPSFEILTGGGAAPNVTRSNGLIERSNALIELSDGLYLVVAQPATFIDELLGWLVAGYRLDDEFASELARITHSDVNLIAGGRLRGSSLNAASRADVASLLASAGNRHVDWLELGGSRFSGREYPLALGHRAGLPSLLLVKDWRPTQALLDQVQSRLLLIGLGAFCLAIAGTTVFSRRATRPLRDVVEAANEITHGDWARRVPVRGTSEAAAMATAFNEMTATLTTLNGQLAAEKARAEDASRAKDQLLANMSHELRTPLNGIIGMTGLALGTALTDEQREYLGHVDASATSLLTLVNDVLDFAAIDAGDPMLEPAPFNLPGCLERCRDAMAPAAATKGLALELRLDGELPANVLGDERRLRQVAVNLLGNAVKFTNAGTVSLHARADGAGGDQITLHVEVRDTGIGIADDQHARIFQPFVQADGSTTRAHGGTGLGLSISARLVERMGGRIWFDSTPGAGSTFYFTAVLRSQTPEAGSPEPGLKEVFTFS
jgi:signal transduction histidine kinase